MFHSSSSSARALTRISGSFLLFMLALSGCGEQAAAPEETAVSTGADTATDAASARAQAIQTATASIDGERIGNADAEPGNWLTHGRTYDEQRFSPLNAINTETVGDLGLAWYWDTALGMPESWTRTFSLGTVVVARM